MIKHELHPFYGRLMFKGWLRGRTRASPLLFVEGYKDHSTKTFALVLKNQLRVNVLRSQEWLNQDTPITAVRVLPGDDLTSGLLTQQIRLDPTANSIDCLTHSGV